MRLNDTSTKTHIKKTPTTLAKKKAPMAASLHFFDNVFMFKINAKADYLVNFDLSYKFIQFHLFIELCCKHVLPDYAKYFYALKPDYHL